MGGSDGDNDDYNEKYYDCTMEKSKRKKYILPCTCCYFVFSWEFYQIFLSNHTSHTFVNNQSVSCIKLELVMSNNRVIDILKALLWWVFILHILKGKTLWKMKCKKSNFTFLLNKGEHCFG